MENDYSHVFSPIVIKGTEFKNRIEVAPTLPFMATPDGVVTPDFVAYYRSFARSGAAYRRGALLVQRLVSGL